MDTDTESGEQPTLSPDEAFAVLGDETRLQILQVLGEASEPLSFSELYERTDYDRTPNFNYHLKKLEGHFVSKNDDGYQLRQAGRRVVVAVLAGAVTEPPVLERTPAETPCFLCGGSMEVNFREETVGLYCADCEGTRSNSGSTAEESAGSETRLVGNLRLPSAGLRGRTPSELVHAAEIWSVAEGQALARGVCPQCSAPVEQLLRICEDHDGEGGPCDDCGREFGVRIFRRCTNCILEGAFPFGSHLLADQDVMKFLIEHGTDPIAPEAFHLSSLDERILSTDPFKARFTFTADGDALTLTVDDDLVVVDVTEDAASDFDCE
jgi:hypothetical protein